MQALQGPEIDDQGRGHAKIQKIRQRIQLGPHFAVSPQKPSQPPVHTIQNTGHQDQLNRHQIITLNPETNGRQARANGRNRQHVRQQL